MTRFLITAILVAIPTYFYTRVVQSIDRFEKEPPIYLVAAFLWGAMPAVIAALVLQIVLGVPVAIAFGTESLSGEFIEGAVNAPVTEEFLKGMAVAIIYFTRRREFDGWVDGALINYGMLALFMLVLWFVAGYNYFLAVSESFASLAAVSKREVINTARSGFYFRHLFRRNFTLYFIDVILSSRDFRN